MFLGDYIMNKVLLDPNSIEGSTCGLFVSAGFGKHPARHMERWEIIYVVNGTLHIAEEDSSFEVKKGEGLLLRPQKGHFGTKPYDQNLCFYWLHFWANEADAEREHICLDQYCKLKRPYRLQEWLHSYLEDHISNRNNQTVKDEMIRLMLYEIADSSVEESSVSALAFQTKLYIHTHFQGKISSFDVAQALGYNGSYLERVFKKAYGNTVTNEIRQARIFYACDLLSRSSAPIVEIAYESGFSSKEDFNRVFKSLKGISPRQYREKKTAHRFNIK